MSSQLRERKGHHEVREFNHHDEQLQVPFQKTQEKRSSSRQKREALQHEVAILRRMLDDEEKLSQVLQRAFHRPIGSLPYLPVFIPNEMKELLSEVAIVEDSIAHLEGETKDLHHGLNHERHLHGLLYHQHQLKLTYSRVQQSISTFPSSISVLRDEKLGTQEATHRRRHASIGSVSEAGSLFSSSSQGVKEERLVSGLGNKEVHSDRSISSIYRRESQRSSNQLSHKDGSRGRDVKTAFKKASQNKLLPEPHDPKMDEREMKNTYNPIQKPLVTITRSQDRSHTSLANRLSEEIMKCLMCIFLRILRTSRTGKPEKSAYCSGSNSSPFPSFLKAETCCNSKDVNLQIDVTRNDPFGIFDNEESISRDIGPYKNFVIINSSAFLLSNLSSCATLLEQLRILFSKLCKVELRSLTYKQKLAFWINMYNSCIMHAYLRNGIPSNIEKLIALIKKVELNIGGDIVNALMIEHAILGQPIELENADVHRKVEDDLKNRPVNKYKFEHRERNLIFALSQGFRSSPAVRIYTAENVCKELEKSKLEYIQASIVVTRTNKLMIPKLLQQYMRVCSTNIDLLIDWICNQLPVSCSLRKSTIHCIRGHKSETISSFAEVMPYQSEFQYLLVT